MHGRSSVCETVPCLTSHALPWQWSWRQQLLDHSANRTFQQMWSHTEAEHCQCQCQCHFKSTMCAVNKDVAATVVKAVTAMAMGPVTSCCNGLAKDDCNNSVSTQHSQTRGSRSVCYIYSLRLLPVMNFDHRCLNKDSVSRTCHLMSKCQWSILHHDLTEPSAGVDGVKNSI